jgi:hypothetical protein
MTASVDHDEALFLNKQANVKIECVEQLGRRRGRRRPVTLNVGIAVRRGVLDIGCVLEDASEWGLGLRLEQPVDIEQELNIEFALPGMGESLLVVAEVRWCYPNGNRTFRAGVLLRERLPDELVAALTR